MHAKRNGYSFSYREVNFFRSSMDLLFEELQKANNKQKQTIVLCGSSENVKKLEALLIEKKIHYIVDEKLEKDIVPGVVVLTTGAISTGFESFDLNLLVISATELFTTKEKKKTRLSQSFKEGETVIFSDLKIGDFVVHRTHGIGEYIGVNTIKADGITKDLTSIAENDADKKLFIEYKEINDNLSLYVYDAANYVNSVTNNNETITIASGEETEITIGSYSSIGNPTNIPIEINELEDFSSAAQMHCPPVEIKHRYTRKLFCPKASDG